MSFDEGLVVGYALGRKKGGKVTELNVTANGTYTAGTGDYEGFKGFSPVKVNVPDSCFEDGYKAGYEAAFKDITGEDYDGYTPTYSQPDDWETNYTDYYVKNDDGTYTAVTGDTAPEFEAGKYYKNTGDITVPQDAYFMATIGSGGSVYNNSGSSKAARIEYIPHSPAYSKGKATFIIYDSDGNALQTRTVSSSGWKFEILNWYVEGRRVYIKYHHETNGDCTTTFYSNYLLNFTATGVSK